MKEKIKKFYEERKEEISFITEMVLVIGNCYIWYKVGYKHGIKNTVNDICNYLATGETITMKNKYNNSISMEIIGKIKKEK